MANETFATFWKLDTIGTVSEEVTYIEGIRWVGGSAAGHQLQLSDVDGNIVWESIANGANFVDESHIPLKTNGLTLLTRGSGTVYVYHKLA